MSQPRGKRSRKTTQQYAKAEADDSDSDTQELPRSTKASASKRKSSHSTQWTGARSNVSKLVDIGKERVPAFGFGTLPMGVLYPEPSKRPSEAQSIEIIHALLDQGVRFFDTADSYCADSSDMHYCEKLLVKAFDSYAGGAPADVFIATKGGMARSRNGTQSMMAFIPIPNTSNAVKAQIRASFAALGGKRPIDLWQVHHVNANASSLLQATLTAVRAAFELVDEGLVRHVGLCNASVKMVEACLQAKLPIVSVQNEFSLWETTSAKPARKSLRAGAAFVCTDAMVRAQRWRTPPSTAWSSCARNTASRSLPTRHWAV